MSKQELYKKWSPILEHKDIPEISGQRKFVTAHALENTERALREAGQFGGQQLLGEATPTNATGAQGIPGQSNSFFNYVAKTTSTSGDPGSTHIIWDNATQANATQISTITNHV